MNKDREAEGECSLSQDSSACAWMSAFWKADYADAVQNCTTGDVKRCMDAVSYAGACEVRGLVSGRQTYFGFNREGGGPVNACYSHGYPPNLVTPPQPISVTKAVEYLATGCRRGDRHSCIAGQNALYNGMIVGLEIQQDFEAAKAFCLTWNPDALANTATDGRFDPEGCDGDGRMKETAEDRSARFARVTEAYAAHQQAWANVTAQISKGRSESEGSMLRAIGLGLSQGMATNAAANESLANARRNIDGTVAASDAKKRSSSSRSALPPANVGRADKREASGPTPDAVAANQKRKDLADCLARPITQLRVAQTNPFRAHAQGFETLLTSAQGCVGAPWRSCMFKASMGPFWGVEARAEAAHAELFRRFNAPGIHIGGSADVCLDQPVKGTRGDCESDISNERFVCLARLKQDIGQMECDAVMLPKVWAAENDLKDLDAKTKQDHACAQRFGG